MSQALCDYLNTLAQIHRVPDGDAIEWKRQIIKSPKLRAKYGCSHAHVNAVAKMTTHPEWRRMCETNKLYKNLDDMANEDQLMFEFDEYELR
jgi:hypothetical protein